MSTDQTYTHTLEDLDKEQMILNENVILLFHWYQSSLIVLASEKITEGVRPSTRWVYGYISYHELRNRFFSKAVWEEEATKGNNPISSEPQNYRNLK